MINITNVRKVFILGDLHLGIKNNSVEWAEIQRSYLVDEFLKQVDAHGFDPAQDILVQVGDWNHVREHTNIRTWQVSIGIAKKLTDKFTKGVYVILGNHDVYYKDRTDVHSLKGMDLMFPNFKIFEKPEVVNINGLHRFLMLPWEDSTEVIKSTIQMYPADFLFCHADVQGFSLNPAQKITHGVELDDLYRFKRVYSGHIHIRQDKGNTLYVGTPYQMDRGDRGNQKGFYVINVSEKKVTEDFIPNYFSPVYKKLDVFSILDLNLEELRKEFENNFIDITIDDVILKSFPLSVFTELVKNLGHRRLEFFNYSSVGLVNSEVEENSNYEYNIFDFLKEKLGERQLSDHLVATISKEFKDIYDKIKNTKSYE
jgi:DNA repair exonuclease SbcCD nuclease subunit